MMKQTKNHLIIVFLILGLAAILAVTAVAEDTPDLLPIEPVPMIQISDAVTTPRASPERFGIIQKIHPHCFVIADMCRGFSGDTIFRSSDGGPPTSRGAFRVGDYVGLRYNKNREVAEIWLAAPPVGIR